MKSLITFVLILFVFSNCGLAQKSRLKQKQSHEQRQHDRLGELPKSLEGPPPEETWFLKNLKEAHETNGTDEQNGKKGKRLSKKQRQRMAEKKAIDKVRGKIRSQLDRTSLKRLKSKDRPAPADVFVIATIDVPMKSGVANIEFKTMRGVEYGADELIEFLKETPRDNVRDYRILSRHGSGEVAEKSLLQVRKEYDEMKEREAQMLAYIAERNRRLAAIKRARRC